MNREIKFRAWDGSKMIDTGVLHDTTFDDGYRMWDGDRHEYLEVMQYTGLKDKHGKEVYEGDVVSHRLLNKESDALKYGIFESFWGARPRVVKFDSCGFSPLSGWIDDAHKDLEWEIIGNVHENPDLLTSETQTV